MHKAELANIGKLKQDSNCRHRWHYRAPNSSNGYRIVILPKLYSQRFNLIFSGGVLQLFFDGLFAGIFSLPSGNFGFVSADFSIFFYVPKQVAKN
jgi:hypothetical protein